LHTCHIDTKMVSDRRSSRLYIRSSWLPSKDDQGKGSERKEREMSGARAAAPVSFDCGAGRQGCGRWRKIDKKRKQKLRRLEQGACLCKA